LNGLGEGLKRNRLANVFARAQHERALYISLVRGGAEDHYWNVAVAESLQYNVAFLSDGTQKIFEVVLFDVATFE